MTQDDRLRFATLCDESSQLIVRARDLLEALELDTSKLPHSAFDEDRALSIVLAGQYSSGKSTIVRALTGRDDVAVGRGITTEEATAYDWNGIRIVDTPGICTGLRPDHDEISRDAITDAEILMYVVTYEGFDSVVAEEFRKLIVDGDKAADTVLVVNKMASANEGNTPEQRGIIAGDLAQATTPYTPEQLRTTFVDAKSYLRAKELENENPRRAKRLHEESNMDELFGVIDFLAREANVGPRLTRSLYLTIDVLSDAKAELAGGDGDETIAAIREGLLRERHMLVSTISTLQTNVRSLSAKAAADIRSVGLEASEGIGECTMQSEAEALLEEAYANVDKIADRCGANIRDAITTCVEQYQNEVDDFRATFNRQVEATVERGGNDNKNPLIDLLGKESMDKFVGLVEKHTIADASKKGLEQFAGSDVHLFFRGLLKKMNVRLKPWGAVKIAHGVNVAGKALGAAGALLGLGLQAKDDIDAVTRMKREREVRAEIIAEFNGFARQLEKGNEERLGQILKESDCFEPRLLQIRVALAGLEQAEQRKAADDMRLNSLIDKCGELIREIHSSY